MKILFLDDDIERTKSFKSHCPNAKCFEEASAIIQEISSTNVIDILFLDHDLGGKVYVNSDEPDTGMEVVRFIVDNKPNIRCIVVHSLNAPAAQNMTEILIREGYDVRRVPFIMFDKLVYKYLDKINC